MKILVSLLTGLLIFTSGYAQQKDIEVFEKKEGNKNLVYARNTGKVSYMVTININATGMTVTPSMKVEAIVPAGYMKELATLVPKPGEGWSYGYDVSFIEYTGGDIKSSTPIVQSETPTDASLLTAPDAPKATLSSSPIIVYTQTGCGRCTTVKREMKTKGITFEEIDVNGGSSAVNGMWKDLRDGGFSGNSVTMPVVRVNGQLHYNIKDLVGFVDGLKK